MFTAADVIISVPAAQVLPFVGFTLFQTLGCSVMIAIYSVIFEETVVLAGDLHPSDSSVFGWTQPGVFWPMMFYSVFMGAFGMAGFNYLLGRMSAMVLITALLSDPLVTGLVAWAAGLEGMPDAYTVGGGLIVLMGVGCVGYGEQQMKAMANTVSAVVVDDDPPSDPDRLEVAEVYGTPPEPATHSLCMHIDGRIELIVRRDIKG